MKILKIELLCLLVLFSVSCSGVFDQPELVPGDIPPEGKGLVRICLDYIMPKALMPTMEDYSSLSFSLEFNCTSAPRAPVIVPNAGSGNETDPVPLEPGDWDFTLNAYQTFDGVKYKAFTGSHSVHINAGETITVSDPEFKLTYLPIESGETGVFSWRVDSDVTIGATGSLLLMPSSGSGSVYSASFTIAAGSEGGYAKGTIAAASGVYDLSITFTNTAGQPPTGDHRVVHIYPGLETYGAFEFSFASIKRLAGTLSIVAPENLSDISPKIKVFSNSGRTELITLVSGSEGVTWDPDLNKWKWVLSIPSTVQNAYFSVEADGINDSKTFTYNEYLPDGHALNIPDRGMPGINLDMTIYGITGFSQLGNTVIASLGGDKRVAANHGTTITLTPSAGDSYRFTPGSITVRVGTGTVQVSNTAPYTFIMPASDVTIDAEFKPVYSISSAGELPWSGGTVTSNKDVAVQGEAVVYTVSPYSNYTHTPGTLELEGYTGTLYSSTNAGITTYPFVMPDHDVSVSSSPFKSASADLDDFPLVTEDENDTIGFSGSETEFDVDGYVGGLLTITLRPKVKPEDLELTIDRFELLGDVISYTDETIVVAGTPTNPYDDFTITLKAQNGVSKTYNFKFVY
ncbi:hypothetical protein FACS189447_04280 [Spirochaetia bacterium]|nr:hypothetical protein FACS189447_04280 [Spirochaetia bacterium]